MLLQDVGCRQASAGLPIILHTLLVSIMHRLTSRDRGPKKLTALIFLGAGILLL